MTRRMKPTKPNHDLEEALKRSRERWDAMDWEEQEAELRQQRESWARQDMD